MELKRRPTEPGGLMAEKDQAKITKGRFIKNLAAAKSDGNRWFFVAVGSLAVAGFCAFGWYKENKRFAENVRVAYVKMVPNGTYNIEYEEEGSKVDYFAKTVESKLAEYVEKRYSKRRDTITTDYGFARLMMGQEMRDDFMENYNAPKVAAEFVKCVNCDQVVAKFRTAQSIDKDVVPGSTNRKQYNTLVFMTVQTKTPGGNVTCENQIVTLIWKFRPMEEIVNRRDELRYNPLGQEIVRDTRKVDPTKVTEQECRKL